MGELFDRRPNLKVGLLAFLSSRLLLAERGIMDSAQHCLDQSAECRRLLKLAQSEAEAQVLKNLSRTWSGLAGQIDRYNALMRRRVVRKFPPEGPHEQGP
jgi:hypothetical protein